MIAGELPHGLGDDDECCTYISTAALTALAREPPDPEFAALFRAIGGATVEFCVHSPRASRSEFASDTIGSVVSHIAEAFGIGSARDPEMAMEVFMELQKSLPYFTDPSIPPHIQALIAMIWTDIACSIQGFSPPATFLDDLRGLLADECPFLQSQAINCITTFISHFDVVAGLDVLAVFAAIAREGQWEAAEAALCDFAALVHAFYAHLIGSNCLDVYFELVREAIGRFRLQNFADICIQMVAVAVDLAQSDPDRFQQCLEIVCMAVSDRESDARILCEHLDENPELHPILALLPLRGNPLREATE
jgi:hypothetical protein